MVHSCCQALLVWFEFLKFTSKEGAFDAGVATIEQEEVRDIVGLHLKIIVNVDELKQNVK